MSHRRINHDRVESAYCLAVVTAALGLIASIAVGTQIGNSPRSVSFALSIAQFLAITLAAIFPVGLVMQTFRNRWGAGGVVNVCIILTGFSCLGCLLAALRGKP